MNVEEVKALEEWQREALKRVALLEAGVVAGALVPSDLVTLCADRVAVADDGTVSGAVEAVEETKRTKSYLFLPVTCTRSSSVLAGNPTRRSR